MNPDDLPDDVPDDLDAFLGWPVTDESAWLIAELLNRIAERWESHHLAQILRYQDNCRLHSWHPDPPGR